MQIATYLFFLNFILKKIIIVVERSIEDEILLTELALDSREGLIIYDVSPKISIAEVFF